jgi:hypothetical protein
MSRRPCDRQGWREVEQRREQLSGMAESDLDPIGEAASRSSLACGPRLDPIGETAVTAANLRVIAINCSKLDKRLGRRQNARLGR